MSDQSSAETAAANSEAVDDKSAFVSIEDLFSDLSDLNAEEPDSNTDREARDVEHLLLEAHGRGLIESRVRTLDLRDAAEAFVGSVIFASPLLVEDGIFDIANHLFETTVYGLPVFLLANTLFVIVMTYALIEWTGRNREEAKVFFGGIPVRLMMTLVVSFLVAAVLMTVWGRVTGWHSPVEAIARINVLWTVGALGAALGDIISKGDRATTQSPSDGRPQPDGRQRTANSNSVPATENEFESLSTLSDSELLEALHEEFDDLAAAVDDATDRHQVNRLREQTVQATLDDAFNDQIQKYTTRDIAEAFVGSIFFSIPFLVEDGVFDVAEFFLSFQVGGVPVFFLVNAAFVLLMILALVYWAGPQDVQVTKPILGVIPRRLVGIAVVSFVTAAALMTMWGRVNGWQDLVIALARISVVWTVASFGAALGDILPGESSGADINDDIAALAQQRDDAAESPESQQ